MPLRCQQQNEHLGRQENTGRDLKFVKKKLWNINIYTKMFGLANTIIKLKQRKYSCRSLDKGFLKISLLVLPNVWQRQEMVKENSVFSEQIGNIRKSH